MQLILLALSMLTLTTIIDQLLFTYVIRFQITRGKIWPVWSKIMTSRLKPVLETTEGDQLQNDRAEKAITRNIHFLVLISNLSPILGVLGTVHGIILTFWEISGKNDLQFSDISQGIAHALYTTAFGLSICLLSMLATWWTERQADELLILAGLLKKDKAQEA